MLDIQGSEPPEGGGDVWKLVSKQKREKPRIQAMKKLETGAGRRVMDYCKSAYPRNPLQQIGVFFDRFDIPAGLGRKRVASFATKKAYVDRMNVVIKGLRAMNINVQNIDELTTKQIRRLFQEFEKQERSAGWMANMNTTVRRFGIWVGKPELCPVLSELVTNPSSAKRQYSALVAQDWEERGVDVELAIQQVEVACEVTGLQLRLAKAFGIRLQEFIMLRIHDSLKIPEYLRITDGTKGGRLRMVPIETDEQRELIERAKAMADLHPKGLLMTEKWRSLRQAIKHAYYILSICGITKEQMGITAHGLRHGYACDIYEKLTGERAPVMGGKMVDPETHKWAVKEITERLGHSREDIVTAYIGSYKGLAKWKKRNLSVLNGLLEGDQTLIELAKEAGIGSIYLIGPTADGQSLGKGHVMPMAFTATLLEGKSQLESDAHAMGATFKLSVRVGQLVDRVVTLTPLRMFPDDISTFEIFLNRPVPRQGGANAGGGQS